jgi:hypothetical protein
MYRTFRTETPIIQGIELYVAAEGEVEGEANEEVSPFL